MRRRLFPLIVAMLLLGGFLAYTVSTLRTTAPTFDEVAHLPAGYAALTAGMNLNPEHPPLAKLLAAAPLLSVAGSIDELGTGSRDLDEWRFGRRFLFGPGRDPDQLMTLGRLPMIGLGVLLCLTCFAWSSWLYGVAGGLTTLAFCVMCPTLLAHTRLVTTDVPVATFGVLAAFSAWRMMQRSSPAAALGTGMALGATFATKFTGVLFVPALGLAVTRTLWHRSRELEPEPARVVRGTVRLVVVVAVALLVVGLSYGWPPSLRPYLEGVRQVGFNHTPGYEFYLLGRYRAEGFPLYFPIAFLVKSSPAVLAGIALWLILPVLRRIRVARAVPPPPPGERPAEAWPYLLLPPLLYALFIGVTAPPIGIRYLIPVLPFLFIALGRLGAALWQAPAGKLVLAGLVALHAHAAAKAWPDPISYFNGLLGCEGPAAIACLDDSNLDWGQDLGRVAETLDRMRRPDEQVVILYFGTADPRAYLKNWRSMQEEEILIPHAQLYAVSLHRLNRLNEKLGRPNDMDWLERFQPVAIVGNTWFIYDFRSALSRAGSMRPQEACLEPSFWANMKRLAAFIPVFRCG